jgi:hypothetical protein
VDVTGLIIEPTLNNKPGEMRPPDILPPPSSATMSNTKAARLPFKDVTSTSLRAERMLAETKRCSVAKRLPPPWAGIPVRVPQPVRDELISKTVIIVIVS